MKNENLDEFGIDVDSVVKSISDFKERYLTSDFEVKLYKKLTEVWNNDHARMMLWKMFRTTSFRYDIQLPVKDIEGLFNLKEFFHMLTYHLFDDGQLYLVKLNYGFPVSTFISEDYKKAIINDRETLFITDVDMEYESNVGKLVKKFEKDSHFGKDIYYSNSYEFEYISISSDDFMTILDKIVKEGKDYHEKCLEWDKTRDRSNFPEEKEIDISDMFKDEDPEFGWKKVYYTKD